MGWPLTKCYPSLAMPARKPKAKPTHVGVYVRDLHVLLVEDCGAWFAQGLELDYAAAGPTRERAKRAFERGLTATLGEHIKIHGTLDRMLRPAPADAWAEYYATQGDHQQRHSQVSIHQLSHTGAQLELPFDRIAYVEAQAA